MTFPPNLGAPPQITLPELKSLHRHEIDGVKYFSGTATYTTRFQVAADATANGKRLYLDLGRVEVIAEVKVNGKPAGNLWKFPYRTEITSLVNPGENALEIEVTNLWPNRLIGDEQQPPEYEYAGVTGGIRAIPDWYAQGKPKPPSPRVGFATWKWYLQGRSAAGVRPAGAGEATHGHTAGRGGVALNPGSEGRIAPSRRLRPI